jgi:hypothetical protein
MKKVILLLAVVLSVACTVPQFFYYNDTRKAIAIRDNQSGSVSIKNYYGQTVMTVQYPSNRSYWISLYKLAPGIYTATTSNGATVNFYRRP